MLFIIQAITLTVVSSWDCGVNPDNQPEVSFVRQHRRRMEDRDRSVWEPIRISYIYDSTFDLGNDFYDVIDAVDQFLGSTLKVRPIVGNLSLDGLHSCGDLVKSSHVDPGIPDTDLVIYVGAEESDEGWIAYAYTCAIEEGGNNNVVAGRIVMNKDISSNDFSTKMSTVIHEIVHVLGFNSSLYEYFSKDESGTVYSKEEYEVKQNIRGKERTLLKYPPLLAEARRLFNCDTLPGVEVEDFGGSGTAGSHWDMRVAYNDFMIGHVTDYPIYSTLTFALLESTGWYKVQPEYLQENIWGANEGCNFHTDKCLTNGQTNYREFCISREEPTCDYFHLSGGVCNIINYDSDLESYNQYFSDPRKGGSDPYVDYCPIRVGYENQKCRDESRSSDPKWGETFGPYSRCFVSDLVEKNNNANYSTRCYELVECIEDKAIVKVGNDNVGYKNLECKSGLFVGWPEEFSGSLQCPDIEILCGDILARMSVEVTGFARKEGSANATLEGAVQTVESSATNPVKTAQEKGKTNVHRVPIMKFLSKDSAKAAQLVVAGLSQTAMEDAKIALQLRTVQITVTALLECVMYVQAASTQARADVLPVPLPRRVALPATLRQDIAQVVTHRTSTTTGIVFSAMIFLTVRPAKI